MASLNKVILIGNLGADPEVRYTQGGDAVTTLSVATTDVWKDKNTGERRESTEWHRVVYFGRMAEVAGQYLRKGSQIYVEGKLVTRKWQDQSGQDRYTTEVRGDELKMLGRRPEGTAGAGSSAAPAPAGAGGNPANGSPTPTSDRARPPAGDSSGFEDFDDDIPF